VILNTFAANIASKSLSLTYTAEVHELALVRNVMNFVLFSTIRLLACLVFVPVADILKIFCDCQYVFSVLHELYVSRHA